MKKIFILALIPNLLAQPILANTIIQKLSDNYNTYVYNKIKDFAESRPSLFAWATFSLFPGYHQTNVGGSFLREKQDGKKFTESFLEGPFNTFLDKELQPFKTSKEISFIRCQVKNMLNETFLNEENQEKDISNVYIYTPNIFTGAPGFYINVTKDNIFYLTIEPEPKASLYHYLRHITFISGIVGLSLYFYKRQTSTKNKQLLKNQTPTKMNIKKVLSQEAQLPLNQKIIGKK